MKNKVINLFFYFIIILFFFSNIPLSSEEKNDSPLIYPETANKSGFIPETIFPKTKNIQSDGLFFFSIEAEKETNISINFYLSDIGDKEARSLSFLYFDGNIQIEDNLYYIKVIQGKKISVWVRLPEKGSYTCSISGEVDTNKYAGMIEYNIDAKKGLSKTDFIQIVLYDAIKNKNNNLIASIVRKDRHCYKGLNNDGMTLLLRASAEGNIEIIRFLLEEFEYDSKNHFTTIFCNVNELSIEGKSALMFASIGGYVEIVKLLLEKGASTYIKSDKGKTALDYAKRKKHSKVISLLEGYKTIPSVYSNKQLIGEWEGMIQADMIYLSKLKIRKRGNKLKGEILLIHELTVDEAKLIVKGKIPGVDKLIYAGTFVCKQDIDLFINNDEVLLIGRNNKKIYSREKMPTTNIVNLNLKAKLSDSGILFGRTNPENFFYLEKKNVKRTIEPLNIEKGKSITISCEFFPEYKYNCYIPNKYDPSISTSFILFSLPGANAPPLSPETAEEHGWISVGKYSSVPLLMIIMDIKHRFNTSEGKIYLAGFSRTGAINQSWAVDLNYLCGGVICMGNWSDEALYFGIPVFYIFGDKDRVSLFKHLYHKGDFKILYNKQIKPKYGSLTELRTFPGGHGWNVPELHAEAMRWLSKYK